MWSPAGLSVISAVSVICGELFVSMESPHAGSDSPRDMLVYLRENYTLLLTLGCRENLTPDDDSGSKAFRAIRMTTPPRNLQLRSFRQRQSAILDTSEQLVTLES